MYNLKFEPSRGMLSSAHVLAMDAKNLLDVVDTIRIQYPHVNSHIIRGGGIFAGSGSEAGSPASSLEKSVTSSSSAGSRSSRDRRHDD